MVMRLPNCSALPARASSPTLRPRLGECQWCCQTALLSRQLSAQLPILIRGFLFEGWVPKRTPLKERRGNDFVTFINVQMEGSEEYRGREDIKWVFDMLNARLSMWDIEDIRACLPEDLRARGNAR